MPILDYMFLFCFFAGFKSWDNAVAGFDVNAALATVAAAAPSGEEGINGG